MAADALSSRSAFCLVDYLPYFEYPASAIPLMKKVSFAL
jgi:hypothetical protein